MENAFKDECRREHCKKRIKDLGLISIDTEEGRLAVNYLIYQNWEQERYRYRWRQLELFD